MKDFLHQHSGGTTRTNSCQSRGRSFSSRNEMEKHQTYLKPPTVKDSQLHSLMTDSLAIYIHIFIIILYQYIYKNIQYIIHLWHILWQQIIITQKNEGDTTSERFLSVPPAKCSTVAAPFVLFSLHKEKRDGYLIHLHAKCLSINTNIIKHMYIHILSLFIYTYLRT